MPETLSYVYTTQAEIERIYSVNAVKRRGDDDRNGTIDTGVLDDVIATVTDEINMYLEPFYEYSDLANNNWVRRQATYMACYHLSIRRGNPSQYESRYNKAIDWLEKIQQRQAQVPRLSVKDNLVPCVSNYTVDHRYVTNKVRVLPTTSTGGTTGDQDIADRLDEQFL